VAALAAHHQFGSLREPMRRKPRLCGLRREVAALAAHHQFGSLREPMRRRALPSSSKIHPPNIFMGR